MIFPELPPWEWEDAIPSSNCSLPLYTYPILNNSYQNLYQKITHQNLTQIKHALCLTISESPIFALQLHSPTNYITQPLAMPYSFFFITSISPTPMTNYTPPLYFLFCSTDRPTKKLYPDMLLSHIATKHSHSTSSISELSLAEGLHLFLSSRKTSGAENNTVIIFSRFAPSTIKDNVPEQLCGPRDTLPGVLPSVESTSSILGLLILHIFSS